MSLHTTFILSLFLALTPFASDAQPSMDPVKGVLAKASDGALDKLSKPGAFSADDAIRIGLPGAGKSLGGLMKYADQAGITNDLSGSLNRAAEQAAGAAKPIFSAAIDKMNVKDAVSIGTGGDTGATDYLRKTAGDQINAQLLPLIRTALSKAGVLTQTSQLSAVGMNEGSVTDYVTKKAADGIFTYMGREEAQLRKDPLSAGQNLLKGLKF